jgi:hypothetical protein
MPVFLQINKMYAMSKSHHHNPIAQQAAEERETHDRSSGGGGGGGGKGADRRIDIQPAEDEDGKKI